MAYTADKKINELDADTSIAAGDLIPVWDLTATPNNTVKKTVSQLLANSSLMGYDNTSSGLLATTVQAAIDELENVACRTEILEKINRLYSFDPDVTLTTTGAGDLQTAINALTEGQSLEIQANAVYSPITLPADKGFSLRVSPGYNVRMTGQNCIKILNGCRDIFIEGIIFEGCTTADANALGSAVCLDHQAICNKVFFYNLTFSLCTGSAVMLSYHQTIGGDTYATPNVYPTEFSDCVGFVGCHFYKSCNDVTEGANLSVRGITNFIAEENVIDVADTGGRGIQCQNCVNLLMLKNNVENGNAGNGELIKIDRLGAPSYYNSGFIIGNICKNGIQGIDIDDFVYGSVINNVCYSNSAEGISIDNDSSASIFGNFSWDNNDGIRLETGAVGNLKLNTCYGNANSNFRMDGGQSYDASNTTSPSNSFVAADNICYDNTISSLTSKNVKAAIDEVVALAAAQDAFIELNDTPSSYTTANALYAVNGTTNGVRETTVVLTEGTNTFNITKGTASFDIAAASAVDINANLTVESASTINQDVTTDASPTFAGIHQAIVTIDTDDTPYSATAANYTILVDCNAGAGAPGNITINLPAVASSTGVILCIIKIDITANTVTLDGNASETINGATTQVISTQWDFIKIQCNGSAWYRIG